MANHVRALIQKDLDSLIPRIQADRKLTADEIREHIEAGRVALVYDDGRVKGCAVVAEPKSETDGITARAWLFTDPAERCKGVDTAVVGYRSDNSCARTFYANRGFKKWFSSSLLRYSGPGFQPISLRGRPGQEDTQIPARGPRQPVSLV